MEYLCGVEVGDSSEDPRPSGEAGLACAPPAHGGPPGKGITDDAFRCRNVEGPGHVQTRLHEELLEINKKRT